MSTEYFKSNGHLDELGISIYVDKMCDNNMDELPENVRLHVEECQQCKMEISDTCDLLKNTFDHRKGVQTPFPGRKTGPFWANQVVRIAAVIIVLVGAAWLVRNLVQRRLFDYPVVEEMSHPGVQDNKHNLPQETDTQKSVKPVDEKLTYRERLETLLNRYQKSASIEYKPLETFAAQFDFKLPPAFVDNSLLERRLGQITLRTPLSVDMLEPAHLSIPRVPFFFTWRDSKKQYTVVIKNNLNQIIWRRTSHSSRIECKTELESGTYYWELRKDNIMIGRYKFFIVQ